ncbi:MAG TPA: alcohol dehydrogenase catalytic domain-containing protein [Armatimonadota bacterium]|nr:alcohol dehydrogenase catalytic domain-containing protein [Armatimonadota bacterium]
MTTTSSPSLTITAARIEVPFTVTFATVTLREPGPGEVLLDVLACGICGFDMEIAESLATNGPQAFGHEICARVRAVGPGVTHVQPGDQVVLESGSFCCDCDLCRNGRVDLCNKGAGFWSGPAMGFAEAMLVPARNVVPARDIAPLAAVLAEPCGVAVDMVKVADIGLTDKVLLVGAGPIGLMALPLIRRATAGPVVVANRSTGKLEKARRLGADKVVSTQDVSLPDLGTEYGGFDRILITAPPEVIPDCIIATAFGGYLVYIGSNFRSGGVIQLDTHALHFGKKQLRPSFASPALYLPEALTLLRTGIIPPKEIVSHVFPLSKLAEAIATVRTQRDAVCKVAVVPDAAFTSPPGPLP